MLRVFFSISLFAFCTQALAENWVALHSAIDKDFKKGLPKVVRALNRSQLNTPTDEKAKLAARKAIHLLAVYLRDAKIKGHKVHTKFGVKFSAHLDELVANSDRLNLPEVLDLKLAVAKIYVVKRPNYAGKLAQQALMGYQHRANNENRQLRSAAHAIIGISLAYAASREGRLEVVKSRILHHYGKAIREGAFGLTTDPFRLYPSSPWIRFDHVHMRADALANQIEWMGQVAREVGLPKAGLENLFRKLDVVDYRTELEQIAIPEESGMLRLIHVLMENGQPEAAKNLAQLLSEYAANPSLKAMSEVARAQAQSEMNELEAAEKSFDRAVELAGASELKPDYHYLIHETRARFYRRIKNQKQAEESILLALRSANLDNAQWVQRYSGTLRSLYQDLAGIYEHSKKPNKAAIAYEQFVRIDKAFPIEARGPRNRADAALERLRAKRFFGRCLAAFGHSFGVPRIDWR